MHYLFILRTEICGSISGMTRRDNSLQSK